MFFPYKWYDDPGKLNNIQLPRYEKFFSKLRVINPLEKYYSEFQSLLDGGVTNKEALSKLILSKHLQLDKKTINASPVCGNKRHVKFRRLFALV